MNSRHRRNWKCYVSSFLNIETEKRRAATIYTAPRPSQIDWENWKKPAPVFRFLAFRGPVCICIRVFARVPFRVPFASLAVYASSHGRSIKRRAQMHFHRLAGVQSRIYSNWVNPYTGVRSSECGPFHSLRVFVFLSFPTRIKCDAPFSFYSIELCVAHIILLLRCVLFLLLALPICNLCNIKCSQYTLQLQICFSCHSGGCAARITRGEKKVWRRKDQTKTKCAILYQLRSVVWVETYICTRETAKKEIYHQNITDEERLEYSSSISMSYPLWNQSAAQ